MIVYIIIVLFLCFFSYRYDFRGEQKGFAAAWYLSFAMIVLLSGLRYMVGSDTIVYMEEFPYMPDVRGLASFDFSGSRYDILWICFCAICKSISPSFFFMQFVLAVIINAIVFWYLRTHTQYNFLSILFYFLLAFLYFNTEILRESLAVGVSLIALNSYYNKKWVHYYIYVLLAALFHISALFLIVLPFVSRIRINKYFILSLLLIVFSASLLWSLFYENIQHLFFVSDNIEGKANAYLDNDNYIYNVNGMIFSIFTYVIIPLLFVLFKMIFVKDASMKEAPFVWMYIVLGVFVMYNNTIFTRFQNYCFFPFIVFITNLLYEKPSKLLFRKVLFVVSFLLLLFGKYYSFSKKDVTEVYYIYQRYFPYSSIIEKKEIPSRMYMR